MRFSMEVCRWSRSRREVPEEDEEEGVVVVDDHARLGEEVLW